MKRRRTKTRPGDVFAVPLCDGSYGLGHVVLHNYFTMCVFFGVRRNAPEDFLTELDDALAHPIAMLGMTDCELKSGRWPVIASREPYYAPGLIPKFECEGASTYTTNSAPGFLEAYHGLRPWDEMPAMPNWHDDMLMPGIPIPPTVRYRRDLASPDGNVATAPSDTTSPISEGPAEIHIQILYPGNDLPTVEQLRRRQELERRLETKGAGEVTDAGGGEGILDVYMKTDDVMRAMPIVERVVAELGLRADTLIETAPLEVDDDDEDDDEA